MKAFDADVPTEILAGNPAYRERIAEVPLDEQPAPIVVIEEIIRGRLNVIRQAESGKARITVEQAYGVFEQTVDRWTRFWSGNEVQILRQWLGTHRWTDTGTPWCESVPAPSWHYSSTSSARALARRGLPAIGCTNVAVGGLAHFLDGRERVRGEGGNQDLGDEDVE